MYVPMNFMGNSFGVWMCSWKS